MAAALFNTGWMSLTRLIWVIAAVVPALIPPACWGADDYERWYTLEMGGKRAGYMHAQQSTADGHITTSTKIVVQLGRGDAAVGISMEGTFVETADGKPVSMESVQRLGKAPVTTRYTFTPKALEIESDQAGQVTKATKPLPEGTWLTPAAAGEYVKQRLEAGASEIVVRTIDPMSGPNPATITRKAIGRERVEAMGKSVEGYRCVSISSEAPGVESVEFLDEHGIPVRSNASMGVISVTIVASTKERALAKSEGPEMMVRTFVKPNRAIENPRELRKARYALTLPDKEIPNLPSSGAQHAEVTDGKAVVTIDADARHDAPADDLKDAAFRTPSPFLNSEDVLVKELTTKALAGAGARPFEQAEAIRRFVRDHIQQKDLGVGFASASEVARSGRGDCTEHATLLAAMLRAAGIPSRVASGLVYADQFAGEREIFGYHMWAQGLIEVDGHHSWLDFDAALGDRRFDATHIALATSALPDVDATNALSALIPLIGRIQIRVESTEP
jgi:hypothetical protein